jgi:hypothetical protein
MSSMSTPVRLSSFGAMTTAASPNRIVAPARPAISRAALAATLASVPLAGAGYSLARSLPAGHVNIAPTCSETCGPPPTTATDPRMDVDLCPVATWPASMQDTAGYGVIAQAFRDALLRKKDPK